MPGERALERSRSAAIPLAFGPIAGRGLRVETDERIADATARVSEARPPRHARLLDLPAPERPRERLAIRGATALSSRELLAVVLGTGSPRWSALELAETLLKDGLLRLASLSV